MRIPDRKTVKTAAVCAVGAAALLFPGGVLMLAAGAALGYWGCLKRSGENTE